MQQDYTVAFATTIPPPFAICINGTKPKITKKDNTMIKKQLFALIILSMIFLTGCNDSNKKSYVVPEGDDIKLNVTLEQNTASMHPLDIIIKLTNISDKTIYYDGFYFPDKSEDIAGPYFKIFEDGAEVGYTGVSIARIGRTFSKIEANETHSSKISLDKFYKTKKGSHTYNIKYQTVIPAKTTDGKSEAFTQSDVADMVDKDPDTLGPEEHTSQTILLISNNLEIHTTK